MSTVMISKRVMQGEQRTSVRRNTRALSLTKLERVHLEGCTTIVDELQASELEFGLLGGGQRGTSRVSAPSSAAGQRLAALQESDVALLFLASLDRFWGPLD